MVKNVSISKTAASFRKNARTVTAGISKYRKIEIEFLARCKKIERDLQRQKKDLQSLSKRVQSLSKEIQRQKEEVKKMDLTISTIGTKITELQRKTESQNRQIVKTVSCEICRRSV